MNLKIQRQMAQEIEIEPGLWLSVVTREKWLRRVEVLKGDDRQFFIAKCNPASIAPDHMRKHFGMCRQIEPHFNPKTDYYVLRYEPKLDTATRER